MNNTIATQNAERLASLSVVFCLMNDLTPNDELVAHLSGAVMYNLAKWYEDHGKTFNPANEIIEDEAIKAAFDRVQEIVTLAYISAQTGIGMEGLGL